MGDPGMVGRYRIVRLIGSGAMGTVHEALDTVMNRPVAIKALRLELTQDPKFVSRFRAEANSLARLNHPNIATLYDSLEEGPNLYLIMELVRGQTLDGILDQRERPLGVRESLAVVAQAADGLSYAHERGVIHRDIKPSNLMVSSDGRIKIMDFGISRVRGTSRLTRTGTVVGTPLYMSPEQCKGGEGDERSDMYSLAIVLSEMLCGEPPFNGATEYDLFTSHIMEPPPSLMSRAPEISPQLETAILTALAKRPEERYASVRAFSEAIGAAAMRANATGVVQSPEHLLGTGWTTTRRKPPITRIWDTGWSRLSELSRRIGALPSAVKIASAAAVGVAAVLAFLVDAGNAPDTPTIEESVVPRPRPPVEPPRPEPRNRSDVSTERRHAPATTSLDGVYPARVSAGCGARAQNVQVKIFGGKIEWSHVAPPFIDAPAFDVPWSGVIDRSGVVTASASGSHLNVATGKISATDHTLTIRYADCTAPITMTLGTPTP
jgi:serine/threonine protein kinase